MWWWWYYSVTFQCKAGAGKGLHFVTIGGTLSYLYRRSEWAWNFRHWWYNVKLKFKYFWIWLKTESFHLANTRLVSLLASFIHCEVLYSLSFNYLSIWCRWLKTELVKQDQQLRQQLSQPSFTLKVVTDKEE